MEKNINNMNQEEINDFLDKKSIEYKELQEKNKLYEINRIKKLQCPNCTSYKKEQLFNNSTQKYLDKNLINEYFMCKKCKKDYIDAAGVIILCEQINAKIKHINIRYLNKQYIGRKIGNLLIIEMTRENALSAPYITHDKNKHIDYTTLNKDIGELQINAIQSKLCVQIFYNDGKNEDIFIEPYEEIFGLHQKFRIIERC